MIGLVFFLSQTLLIGKIVSFEHSWKVDKDCYHELTQIILCV